MQKGAIGFGLLGIFIFSASLVNLLVNSAFSELENIIIASIAFTIMIIGIVYAL